jgi:hypothetical protein
MKNKLIRLLGAMLLAVGLMTVATPSTAMAWSYCSNPSSDLRLNAVTLFHYQGYCGNHKWMYPSLSGSCLEISPLSDNWAGAGYNLMGYDVIVYADDHCGGTPALRIGAGESNPNFYPSGLYHAESSMRVDLNS